MKNTSLSPLHTFCFFFGGLAMFVLISGTAGAQDARGLSDVTANIGTNVRKSVPIIPMVSYVLGVFFTAVGLFRLRDWVIDGDKNPLAPVLIHLLVATFLIMLPHTIRLVTGTFFNRGNGEMFVNVATPPPALGAFCKSSNPDCR